MDHLDLIGTPFKYGGRSPDKDGALDCYGVVVEMGRRRGLNFPERQFSEDLAVNHALMACQMDEWKRIEGPEPGSVVLIRILGKASHVGFVLDGFSFIHAWEGSNGVVVEPLEDWEKRIEGFYQYVGK